MKDFYIKLDETKREKQSNGKYKTLYRCGCKICEKCWFSLEAEVCCYGGPYAGYEKAKDNS